MTLGGSGHKSEEMPDDSLVGDFCVSFEVWQAK
jgi:hypothetical protein